MSMKHFTKIMSAAVLTAATLSFPGCQDYDAGFEAKEIAYRKNFEKAFGQIDPEQDFNLATRGSVTVTTNEESNVKIYAKSGRIYTIVGNYSGVSGTQKLEFDVVEGTTQLLVTDGKAAEYVNVGDEVHFAPQTRTMCNLGSIVSVSSEYKQIPAPVITAYTTVIPEEENNYNKVSCNFYWVSTGSFTFYPMYWDTGEHHTMGIYWTDSEGYHELDVYKDKCGDEVQYPDPNGIRSHWDGEKTVIDGVDSWLNEGVGKTISYHAELGLRSKGITISLPVGQVFGMYIRDYNGCQNTWDEENKIGVFNDGSAAPYWTVYSEEEKNAHCALAPYNSWSTPEKAPAGKMIFASTFQANATVNGKTVTNTYFAFEDMHYFPDLNDLIFMFDEDSNIPVTVDNDADGWILAYEDLGNSFDWDYNDVVLAVEHVSGETSAKIIPLAAGGTLASYVKYNGSYVTGSKETSEIHQLFGQAAAESGNYTPINADDKGNIGFVQTITVPTDFSMTTLGATTGAISEMGGITLEVEPADGSSALPTTIVYSLENKGKAPEVMCLPQSWHEHSESNGVTTTAKHEWRWPSELSNIDKAYSQFAAWAKDRTNIEWYKQSPNMSYCVTGTFDYTSTSTAIGGGGTGSGTTVGAITLVSDEVTIVVNEVKTLIGELFTTTSTGKIHYSLSNSKCSFEDDNTKIKGATQGAVDLTILQEADATHDQCKAVIHINVVNANDLKMYVNGVTADNTINVTVNQGETVQLQKYQYTYADGALTYSIAEADKAIATVSETGLITGVATGGPVTITVTQAATTTYAGGTATVNVTVTAPLPAGMSWSGPTTIYVSNGVDVWLTGLSVESDATAPTFSSNNEAVVPSSFSKQWNSTVGNHVYKATAGSTAGTAVITITQGKTEGKYRASELTLTVKVASDPQFKFSDGTNATKNIVLSPSESNNPFTGCTKLSNGTISYSVTDGDDVVSVNSSTGEITVKDGVTEGEATVVATLAEEGNYNGAELSVHISVISYGTPLAYTSDKRTEYVTYYDISTSTILSTIGEATSCTITLIGESGYYWNSPSLKYGQYTNDYGQWDDATATLVSSATTKENIATFTVAKSSLNAASTYKLYIFGLGDYSIGGLFIKVNN